MALTRPPSVEAASAALFGRGELAEVDPATLGAALREAPHVTVPAGDLPTLVDLLVATELSASKSAARRAIDEGGAYVNNERCTDAEWRPAAERPVARSMAGAATRQADLGRRRGGVSAESESLGSI